jgi:hypothetical protein
MPGITPWIPRDAYYEDRAIISTHLQVEDRIEEDYSDNIDTLLLNTIG